MGILVSWNHYLTVWKTHYFFRDCKSHYTDKSSPLIFEFRWFQTHCHRCIKHQNHAVWITLMKEWESKEFAGFRSGAVKPALQQISLWNFFPPRNSTISCKRHYCQVETLKSCSDSGEAAPEYNLQVAQDFSSCVWLEPGGGKRICLHAALMPKLNSMKTTCHLKHSGVFERIKQNIKWCHLATCHENGFYLVWNLKMAPATCLGIHIMM